MVIVTGTHNMSADNIDTKFANDESAAAEPREPEPKTPVEIIAAAVWTISIRECRGAMAKEIATEVGRSVSWVRKHWQDPMLSLRGIKFTDVYVAKYEKNYGTHCGDQRVDALAPSWEALAQRVRELQGK